MGKKGAVPRGYHIPADHKCEVKQCYQTSLLISSATACSNWALIAICMIVGNTLIYWGWLWLPLHILIFWPLCSRALRGQENLIHEASHGNFYRADPYRNDRDRNDRVANWLCAYWLLLSVAIYRVPHLRHHDRFGTDEDPDKQRFDRLQLDQLPREAPGRFFRAVLRLMPTYVCDYWKQFRVQEPTTTEPNTAPPTTQGRQFLLSLGLHGVLMGLCSLIIEQFWLNWLLYFWVPFCVYLPLHRFLAEAEEHRYENAQSIFAATFSNLGWFQRWYLHPHGDSLHLLHHICPTIPHWQLRRLHNLLLLKDPAYRQGRVRTSMFEEPR